MTVRYGRVLTGLMILFCLRVLGQALVFYLHADFYVPFLPPMAAWMSGLLPYRFLLPAQILIIALIAKVCADLRGGHGFFVGAHPALADSLTGFGLLYVIANSARCLIFGITIPVIFHFVLAASVLTYARYQRRICHAGIR